MRGIHIGILGLGNVGAGVLRILQENRETIEGRLAASVRVKKVLVRDLQRRRGVEVAESLLTTDPEVILNDPDIRIVVELLGGIEPARTYALAALRAGKHLVTANKALLAACGAEIFQEAASRGLQVYFEGSVGGGIPVLRALREGLASDRITGLVGIVNGTSNFILDSMTRDGIDYSDALERARGAGYAEADPTLDVSGKDAAHKLALLALVSFGVRVDPEAIPCEGIDTIRRFDIETAGGYGYVIKSLAIADLDDEGLPRLRVHPTLVPRDHVLAGVHGIYNAVMVESRALGRSLYYGPGAGMMPTGVVVVSDIIEVCRGLIAFTSGGPPPEAFEVVREVDVAPMDALRCANYLCVHVINVPGVLGRVASTLGKHGVGIERMNQSTPRHGEPMNMVLLTEDVDEIRVSAALLELDAMAEALAPTRRIRVLPPEVLP